MAVTTTTANGDRTSVGILLLLLLRENIAKYTNEKKMLTQRFKWENAPASDGAAIVHIGQFYNKYNSTNNLLKGLNTVFSLQWICACDHNGFR